MKTAISVPDETFRRVTRRASELGISRSELFSRAAREYLDDLDSDSLTARIDEALAHADSADDSSAAAVDAGRRLLACVDDEW